MTTIADINGRLVGNLNLLTEELTEVATAAGAAALQYQQLTASSVNAETNSSINGLNVVGSSGRRVNADGTSKNTSIAVFSDKLSTFGSLTTATGGALLVKTVTAATVDASGAAFKQGFASALDTKTLFQASLVASEALADSSGLPLGSSSVDLVTAAGKTLVEKSNRMLRKIGSTVSLLEDISKDDNIENNIQLTQELADLAGNPSIPVTKMDKVPSRTFLQTYEEMESYLRSSFREITEVIVSDTDTTRDIEVNYDTLRLNDVGVRKFTDVANHFLIMQDGTLQVCRPISEAGQHSLPIHNPNSIGLLFAGGLLGNKKTTSVTRSSKSYTMQQLNTFDAFMKAFYTVVPGGQAWGHNDIDPDRRADPHFNVPRYVQKKFNKFNTQTIEEKRENGSLTIDQLIEAQS